jgi:hypothetical protein
MWKIFKFFLFIVSIILVASCLSCTRDLKEAGEDAGHYFLVHKYPYERIAGVLENLMMHEPK